MEPRSPAEIFSYLPIANGPSHSFPLSHSPPELSLTAHFYWVWVLRYWQWGEAAVLASMRRAQSCFVWETADSCQLLLDPLLDTH